MTYSPFKEKMYSVTEVANLLYVSSDTIRRYCRLGDIRGVKVNKRGKYLIPQSEIDGFVERMAKEQLERTDA